MSALPILLLLPLIFAASCKGPDMNECGCPSRPIFDEAWLKANHKDVADKYSTSTFQAPTMDYSGCNSIVATCPSDHRVCAYYPGLNDIITHARLFPNPVVAKQIECRNGVWYKEGLNDEAQSTMFNYTLSCIKP